MSEDVQLSGKGPEVDGSEGKRGLYTLRYRLSIMTLEMKLIHLINHNPAGQADY